MAADEILRTLFLACFALWFLIETALSVLNARFLKARRGQIPEPVKQAYSPETYERSISYALARQRLGHVERVAGSILTLVFLFSGLVPMLNESVSHGEFEPLTHGVAVIAAFLLLNGALGLPLELYATFGLEARFGFNKTTLRTYVLDKLKELLLSLAIGVPFLYGLLALIAESGPLWWLWVALFVIAFQFLMMILFPLVIAPLFNKFAPLPEGELKTQLEELARNCAFAVRGIFVVDGSRRSAHSNAYFAGLGKARRIVLFDTLLQQLSVPETTAVLAHEIGHYKRKHILKALALSSVLTLAGCYVLSLLLYWHPLYQAFGMAVPNEAKGLITVGLIAGAFMFWAGPLLYALSRRYEYQADAYAAEQTGGPAAMESALLKIHEKNLSTPMPHRAYSAWHYSHPTLLERIEALRRQSAVRAPE
ncbi:MAG: M48 family metallopeptidase [Planctomycetota bacterium]|nr:M48 family metallopeptidase [Planctomycetota bacterium]